MRPEDILDFWFADGMESKWYFAGPEFDQELMTRFSEVHRQAVTGELSDWKATRSGRLALILLLDQFSRNIHRDQPAAYAQDTMAFEIAQMSLRMGDDLYYKANHPPAWRGFIYVVFMHQEDLEAQRRSVELYQTHGPEGNLNYARIHLEAIARFGRFPNRNLAMGRETTEEEQAFLEAGGISWVPAK